MQTNIVPLVLVVDDEAGFLEIMQAKLESQGFQVITAVDGNDAIMKAKRDKPAIILMDIELPEKDGVTAAAELTADPITKDIPVIFVTNLDHEIVDALAKKVSLSINAKNYFRKDGDYNLLIKEIRSASAV
jgi:two-component system alkaline phosphatase synthesis response regulator PhoP